MFSSHRVEPFLPGLEVARVNAGRHLGLEPVEHIGERRSVGVVGDLGGGQLVEQCPAENRDVVDRKNQRGHVGAVRDFVGRADRVYKGIPHRVATLEQTRQLLVRKRPELAHPRRVVLVDRRVLRVDARPRRAFHLGKYHCRAGHEMDCHFAVTLLLPGGQCAGRPSVHPAHARSVQYHPNLPTTRPASARHGYRH